MNFWPFHHYTVFLRQYRVEHRIVILWAHLVLERMLIVCTWGLWFQEPLIFHCFADSGGDWSDREASQWRCHSYWWRDGMWRTFWFHMVFIILLIDHTPHDSKLQTNIDDEASIFVLMSRISILESSLQSSKEWVWSPSKVSIVDYVEYGTNYWFKVSLTYLASLWGRGLLSVA